jgi:hypothetical protein
MIAVVSFGSPADCSRSKVQSISNIRDHRSACPLEPYAETFAADLPDLNRSLKRYDPDPEHEVNRRAKRFVRTEGPSGTPAMLVQVTKPIKQDGFNYAARTGEDCQYSGRDPAFA